MQRTDRAPVVAEGEGSPSSPGDSLSAALGDLYRAFQKSSIYPPHHPAIPEAVGKVLHGLEQALDGRSAVVVGVAKDHLLDGEARLGEAAGVLSALAQLMHQLDLAAVEFQAGMTARELESLVRFLGRARREKLKGARLSEELRAESVTHVRLQPIDYRALLFSDGSQETSPDRLQDPWEHLARAFSDPQHGEGLAGWLAREAGEHIERREGEGVGSLRRSLHRAFDEARGLDPGGQRLFRARLASFVAGLEPDLRRDLLRVDAGSRTSLNLLGQLAEQLPARDVLQALEGVARAGGRLPDEVVLLMNKLVRVAERPTEGSESVPDILRQWGLDPEPDSAAPEALAEVFTRRSTEEYNPGSYQRLLGAISKRRLGGSVQASALRYRDPGDGDDVREHAAEIGVQLLARKDGDGHRQALLAYTHKATGFLIERGRFDVLLEATLCARAHSALKGDPEPTRHAARCYLDEFVREERIRAILDGICRLERVPEEAFGLLVLGGATAVDLALDRLREPIGEPTREALWRFVRERGAELLGRVLELRAERGGAALRPVLDLVRELPTSEAVPLLEQLAVHRDYRVRSEALTTLIEVDRQPGAADRHLRRALLDPNRRVVGLAIRRLAEKDDPESLELLGRYVADEVRGAVPTAGSCRRAARALVRRGDPGIERLGGALMSLVRSPAPRHALLARLVAECLEAERTNPEARRVLRRWRWSVNWLIGLLLSAASRLRVEDPS